MQLILGLFKLLGGLLVLLLRLALPIAVIVFAGAPPAGRSMIPAGPLRARTPSPTSRGPS